MSVAAKKQSVFTDHIDEKQFLILYVILAWILTIAYLIISSPSQTEDLKKMEFYEFLKRIIDPIQRVAYEKMYIKLNETENLLKEVQKMLYLFNKSSSSL